ncbi:cobalt-precorrin-7 (C(5))-methyltransferase [Sodalis ligni]|nr:cobalt-precorrin-7 (C(5))-methyltransferase [Sodalis ligni]
MNDGRLSVVGLGPGDVGYLTPRARELIERCDVLIGSPRQLACFPEIRQEKRLLDASLPALAAWLAAHREQRVVVLASGDPMLYGIGDYLSRHADGPLLVVPGISAVQYLFSRLGLSMNDIYLTSSHGREPDFDFILRHGKVAMMTDRHIGPYEIARQILSRGLRRTLAVGENLSYADERIHILSPDRVAREYDMNVVAILDEHYLTAGHGALRSGADKWTGFPDER